MHSNLCNSLAPWVSVVARWTRGTLLLSLLCLLGACAALPPRGVVEPSQALPYQSETPLAMLAAASRPSDATAASGFRLLPTGEFAFDARMALVRRAHRSIDLQAYHIHHDVAGRALLRELRDAAQRGVRVRLLVDDYHAGPILPLLADLAAHSSIQVRLFNPLPLRAGLPILRLLLSPGAFERHNHRMHNKLLVVDNTMAVFGGRNVADEYFMGHAEANFIDLDVLSTGAVVQELSSVFDRYWNSEAAWPVLTVQGGPAPQAVTARERFDAEVGAGQPPPAPYDADPAGHPSVESQIRRGWLTLHHASAQVFADPPEKALSHEPLKEPSAAMTGMLGVIARAQREVHIVSPYFVPGPIGMAMMSAAAAAGGRTVLYTNSLGTTDEPLVHHRYSSYRVPMLRLGVEILEFSPVAVQRSLGFGRFGASTPRLHAKVALVDRRHLLVGSVNLDGRSAVGNTEMAVAIDSPALAAELRLALEGERAALLYRLRLGADGQSVEWLSRDTQGETQVSTEEPGTNAWLRFKLWLQSMLVDERLL
jgi:putative cardiolipin synthase